MKRFITAGLLATAICTPSYASEIDTGNGFMSTCGEPANGYMMFCLGYIRGLTSGITPNGAKAGDTIQQQMDKSLYCLPDGSTNGQTMDTLLRFIRENPQVRHYTTYPLFVKAMNEAYPCPGNVKITLKNNGWVVER